MAASRLVLNAGRDPLYRLRRLGDPAAGHALVKAVENVPMPPAHPQALLNHENAVIPDAKLREYALNPNHAVGGHKARVIASALGFTVENADELKAAVMQALPRYAATPHSSDSHGDRFTVDMDLTGPAGSATVRTGWIIRSAGGAPSLTSIRVEKRGKGST